jgi:5-methylcytosine-specific restriction endonuclease McrA
MGQFIDLTGKKFYRLTVIRKDVRKSYGNICWLCRCDCGKELVVFGGNLRRGFTRSCGCLQDENRRKPTSDKTKKLMSMAHKGKQKHSIEVRKKMSLTRKGRKHTEEQKQKISNALRIHALRGEKHPFWKGGNSRTKDKIIRQSVEYKLWRKAVFERNKYACIWCGLRGGRLNADHIKPFALYPELRFAIDNGRTLCVPCHQKTDTYGGNSLRKKKPDQT